MGLWGSYVALVGHLWGSYGALVGHLGTYGALMGHLWGTCGVSKAAAELLSYCEAHAGEDPLLAPVPTAENPFREKKLFCALL
uniref:Guanine nucleotide-binding protein subunit gamma n=1 Tax=Phasianus colchicus TaxID=9054 RepID=A0A669QB28_PHACC